MAGSDNSFHISRTSVPTFRNLAIKTIFKVNMVIATGETVGLAEWIIIVLCILNTSMFIYVRPTYTQKNLQQYFRHINILLTEKEYFSPHLSIIK